jgi:hypothetical protein
MFATTTLAMPFLFWFKFDVLLARSLSGEFIPVVSPIYSLNPMAESSKVSAGLFRKASPDFSVMTVSAVVVLSSLQGPFFFKRWSKHSRMCGGGGRKTEDRNRVMTTKE